MKAEQIRRFLAEADRLKSVDRRSRLIDDSRLENSAEHTWHAILFAIVLAPDLEEPVELAHVLKLLAVHDLVEIDAGDTYAYDDAAHEDKEHRERRAADRLFGLLPPTRAGEFRRLWDEYEAQQTREARFARSCDKLQPLSLNVASNGAGWKRGGINRERLERHHGDTHAVDPAQQSFFDYLVSVATVGEMFGDGA